MHIIESYLSILMNVIMSTITIQVLFVSFIGVDILSELLRHFLSIY